MHHATDATLNFFYFQDANVSKQCPVFMKISEIIFPGSMVQRTKVPHGAKVASS